MAVGDKIRVHCCADCNCRTVHQVVAEYRETYRQEDHPQIDAFATGTWQVIQCAGCETASFRELWESPDDYDPEGQRMIPREHLYPQRSEGMLPLKRISGLPPRLNRIYRETIETFNNEQLTLCTGGVRAILEGLCQDRGVEGGIVPIRNQDGIQQINQDGTPMERRTTNLEGMIYGLHQRGILGQQHAETLHPLRILGNAALHELEQPSVAELRTAIDIIEATLISVYSVPHDAAALRAMREDRV